MKHCLVVFFVMLSFLQLSGQNTEEVWDIDIFIIDSYVTPEKPHKLRITFFTSDSAYAKVVLADEYEFNVNEIPNTDHDFQKELKGMTFDSTVIPFYVIATDGKGKQKRSEVYDIALPEDNELLKGKGSSLFTICCFGGLIFGMPSPTLVVTEDKNHFSLTKEIPIVSFYSKGYNYPISYISAEYSHIFEADRRNYFRLGFKYIFQPGVIEFISPGLNGFTDFKGFNGLSPEMTLGLFKVYDAFTVYARYRFNFQPDYSSRNFHEFSIGLYSSFFTFNL